MAAAASTGAYRRSHFLSLRSTLAPLLPECRVFRIRRLTKPQNCSYRRRFARPAVSAGTTTQRTVKKGTDKDEDDDDEGGRIRRLQNGSDVRGVAMEGEKVRPVDLTPEAVACIAEDFGEWLGNDHGGCHGRRLRRVSLGRDPRLSEPKLATAAAVGLERAGCRVFDIGLATTPACFMSTVLAVPGESKAFDASIMITAWHLPFSRNGMKFSGGLNVPDVESMCASAAEKYVNLQRRRKKQSCGQEEYVNPQQQPQKKQSSGEAEEQEKEDK